MAKFDPSRPDFAPYGLSCERWTPGPMRRADRHNEIEINLLTGGHLTYLIGGRRETMTAGEIAVFWAAIPHQVLSVEDCPPYFVATLPMALFLQFGLPEKLTQPILHAAVARGPATEDDPQLLARWSRDLEAPSTESQRIVLLEMEARLRRLSAHLRPTSPQKPRGRGVAGMSSKAEAMAVFIARSYAQPLSIDDIADTVGLHPNYAMNLFKSMFGSTLSQYLTEHRVWHAQRLLASADRPVLEVAMEAGFTSLSRFNDVFRRSCGCSPREYRKAHRLGDRVT